MVWKLLILFFYQLNVYSQDERAYRALFMDSLKQEKQALGTLKPWATKATPMYSYDFDNDGRIEKMVFEKRDGEDRLNIHDWWGKKIFTVNFDSYSLKSKIYKILITKISQNVDLFLIYYYEGAVDYLEFESVARLYFLTLENKNISTLKLTKGPIFWEEFSSKRGHYRQKRRKINLYDFDGDGFLDVQVKQRRLSHVFLYKGNGVWTTYPHSVFEDSKAYK